MGGVPDRWPWDDDVTGRQRAALTFSSAVALIVALVAAVGLFQRIQPPQASPVPVPTLGPPRTFEPQALFPTFTVHVDDPVPEGTRDPTAHQAQSKVWFAHGAWWAVMTAPNRPALTIHRLDLTTQTWIDTLTLVDERSNANADASWDGDHLVVATAIKTSGASGAARIIRYHFDGTEGRFVLDPDFPVRITEVGVEAIVVDRDSLGILWVAFIRDSQVYVSHSTTSDAVWVPPVALPWPDAFTAPDDIASVVAFGPGRIGVLWTNQRTGAILFTSRADGDPDATWTEPESALEGEGLADDHLNAKVSADGRLLVAVKTSLNDPLDPNLEAPLTLLLERHDDGNWSQFQFGRVRDRHTRPIILIDEVAGQLYMFATSPAIGGTVYVKRTRLDFIEFEAGLGVPLIEGADGAVIADPTSTKNSISAEEGFVILAFDKGNRHYVHAVVGGAGGSGSPWPSPPPDQVTVYFADTFEPWPAGSVPGNGFELRDALEGGLTVATDPAHGKIAVLAASAASAGARACKPFSTLDTRPVTAEISVRAGAIGESDIVGLALRGSGGDVTSIRFGQGGTFSYYDGALKIRSKVAYALGHWYRMRATVDTLARTAAIEVIDEASGARVLNVAGLAWRLPEVVTSSTICVQVPATPAASLAFDNVSVSQR